MNFESFLFDASIYGLLIAVIINLFVIVTKKIRRKRAGIINEFGSADKGALCISLLSLLIVTALIILRILETGHGPFTNMYEFAVAFVWGVLLISLLFSWKYRSIMIELLGSVFCLALLLYANTLSAESTPLVPALQNSFLLSAHVFSAVIAYGSFTVGLISSAMLLIQKNDSYASLPGTKALEKISYHSVVIGFPFMTLVIVLGALWADVAWGRFWGWDPKETASLVTWLIYAGYLHMRIIKKGQGRKGAILLIIGFIAVVFTFFGNYIFSGLHSYI